jgi:K+ transporter
MPISKLSPWFLVEFAQENRSVTMFLVSTILTGFMYYPSFSAMLVHGITFLMLLFVWWQAKKSDTTVSVSITILMATGLQAVMMHEDRWHLLMLGINLILLVTMAVLSSAEGMPSFRKPRGLHE